MTKRRDQAVLDSSSLRQHNVAILAVSNNLIKLILIGLIWRMKLDAVLIKKYTADTKHI